MKKSTASFLRLFVYYIVVYEVSGFLPLLVTGGVRAAVGHSSAILFSQLLVLVIAALTALVHRRYLNRNKG